jgi:hypothetical protein
MERGSPRGLQQLRFFVSGLGGARSPPETALDRGTVRGDRAPGPPEVVAHRESRVQVALNTIRDRWRAARILVRECVGGRCAQISGGSTKADSRGDECATSAQRLSATGDGDHCARPTRKPISPVSAIPVGRQGLDVFISPSRAMQLPPAMWVPKPQFGNRGKRRMDSMEQGGLFHSPSRKLAPRA